MNAYKEMRNRHQQEFNSLPIKFAFGKEQFERMMSEWGLKPTDTDKIYGMSGTGGFYLRTDAAKIREWVDRNHKEHEDAIKADTTGEGFIYDMFLYELLNHEYGYTLEIEDTLMALGIGQNDIENNPALANGLRKARNKIHEANGIEWRV